MYIDHSLINGYLYLVTVSRYILTHMWSVGLLQVCCSDTASAAALGQAAHHPQPIPLRTPNQRLWREGELLIATNSGSLTGENGKCNKTRNA